MLEIFYFQYVIHLKKNKQINNLIFTILMIILILYFKYMIKNSFKSDLNKIENLIKREDTIVNR